MSVEALRRSATPLNVPGLDAVRSAIDRVDAVIVDLLAKRARLTRRAALLKLAAQAPARDLAREAEVRRHYLSTLTRVGWTEPNVEDLMRMLIGVTIQLQRNPKIAFQGGPGAWTEEVMKALLPEAVPLRFPTFEAAWQSVERQEADACLMPVGNSQTGDFPENRALLEEADIVTEVVQPVGHALIARPDTSLDRIRRILGHPRALEQCTQTLRRLARDAEWVPTVDGAAAAATLEPGDAALGSPRLAERYGLVVLHSYVCDRPGNETVFRLAVRSEIL